jgi:hypothetical protein
LDESAAFEAIEEVNEAAAPSQPGAARRAQHAKHHGCVTATFTIRDDIPADLRHGVFATVASYPAKIRFSNGRQTDDRTGDAHGMAIKLLDVPGTKLLEGQETQRAQDFILVDSETFFTGDLDLYVRLNQGLMQPNQRLWDKLAFGFWLFVLHLPLALRAKRFASRTPTSPLTQSYFGAVPCSIDKTPVKWVAQPASTRTARPLDGPDGLSEALRRDLAEAPFVFDFGVDVQTDPQRQPVDDPTVAWSQVGARRVWLARLEIAAQAVEPHAALAEDIAYSPWHGLVAHMPLGAINRARKSVYRKLAIHRHQLNGVTPADTSELP